MQEQVKQIAEKYKHGDYVYLYYKFLDKFHTEPKGWQDLFEFLSYVQTEGKISNCITRNAEVENGK